MKKVIFFPFYLSRGARSCFAGSICLFVYLFICIFPVFAQSCDLPTKDDNLDRINEKMAKCNEAWNQMETAKRPHLDALRKMENDIAAFQARIKILEADTIRKAQSIAEGEKALSGFLDLAGGRIRNMYVRSRIFNPLIEIFSSDSLGDAIRRLGYSQLVIDEDKKMIAKTAVSVKDLEERKKQLEKEQSSLAYIKEETDKKAVSIRKLVGEATAYQGKLTSILAALSAQQQQFLAAKLSNLNISRSAVSIGACVDDRNVDPGFSPRFALFTFGVPNRIGLNQYGAKGRAEAGQNARDILSAYYSADYTTGYNTGINIRVSGKNEYGQTFDDNWNIEEYLKHLYEMPSGWPSEALKSQAIAARSYALSYTNNGSGSICPSQQCQVVKKELNSESWQKAVRDTAGIVLTRGGTPIKAWYSSTHGGYSFTSGDIGWNNTDWTKRLVDATGGISSFSDLFSTSYDRGSPWFYCDWGSRAQYNKTAWLKPEELADIVNILLLAKRDSGTQNHLVQVDKPNPDGVETWDAGRVRSELSSRGGTPYTSVSDVSIGWDQATGRTTQVTVSGNAGSNSFDGNEFKMYFNLRAPATIQIVGPLYNVEKR